VAELSRLVFDTLRERAEGLEAGFPILRGISVPVECKGVACSGSVLGLRLGGRECVQEIGLAVAMN